MNKTPFTIASAVLLTGPCITAHADSPDAEIGKLQQAIEQQQVQLDAQQQQLQNLLQAGLSSQDEPRWSMAYGRPTLSSGDGRSTLAIRALVQADSAHYSQDAAGPLATDYRRGSTGTTTPNRENNSARDLSDGTYFRRGRLGIEGTLNRDFNYNLTLELGGSGSEGAGKITNAWVSYTGFAPFTIQMGAFAPIAGLDDSIAPEDALFIEKAAPAEIARSLGGADGRTALAMRGSGARWMGSLALTGRTVADAEVYDAQNAVVARIAGLAVTSTDYHLHLGASGTYVLHPANAIDSASAIDLSSARYVLRFRNQPELRADSTRLIDTGNIDATHAYAAGAELAGNWRNWFFQGEHFWYGIERRLSTLSNPAFSGYYLEGSWMITGESRRYNMTNGSYQNPRPFVNVSSRGGWGAWELALRYSHTDMNYHEGIAGAATPADGVRGGVQNILTTGVNWYLNPNLKLVFNYLHIDVDRLNPSTTAFGSASSYPQAAPAGSSPPVGVQIGQTLNAYALRVQYSL
ncbi:MAG: OprO/OprP family phosphate-selective porin [Steroidobacteraceae bacterium]